MGLRQSAPEAAALEAATPWNQSARQQSRLSWGTWRLRGVPSVHRRHLGGGTERLDHKLTTQLASKKKQTLALQFTVTGVSICSEIYFYPIPSLLMLYK